MDAAASSEAAEEDDEPAVVLIDDDEQQQEEGGADGGLGRRSRRSKRRRRDEQRPSLAPEEQTLRIRVSELACVVGLHPFQCIIEAVMNHVYQGASMLSHVTSPDKTNDPPGHRHLYLPNVTRFTHIHLTLEPQTCRTSCMRTPTPWAW